MINEYKKARVLMADSAATNKSGVWQSLFHEVEKVRALAFPPPCAPQKVFFQHLTILHIAVLSAPPVHLNKSSIANVPLAAQKLLSRSKQQNLDIASVDSSVTVYNIHMGHRLYLACMREELNLARRG